MQQLWFDCIPTTITIAKEQFAQNCEQGLIVVARTQSQGRGQFERRFDDQPGQALLYSQVFYLQQPPEDFAYVVGTYVQQFLQHYYQITVEIKRPNDLYYQGRKLAGILLEPQYLGQQLEGVIVSIGLNVHSIPPTQPEAICLQMIHEAEYDVRQIAQQLQAWLYKQLLNE